mmetsp:Transcript_96266/g.277259  ORF Transcript_96266/g.277259 Transcript_96266/m.277259 type:complete len:339 (-) Transcript_96266:337-1353(-)
MASKSSAGTERGRAPRARHFLASSCGLDRGSDLSFVSNSHARPEPITYSPHSDSPSPVSADDCSEVAAALAAPPPAQRSSMGRAGTDGGGSIVAAPAPAGPSTKLPARPSGISAWRSWRRRRAKARRARFSRSSRRTRSNCCSSVSSNSRATSPSSRQARRAASTASSASPSSSASSSRCGVAPAGRSSAIRAEGGEAPCARRKVSYAVLISSSRGPCTEFRRITSMNSSSTFRPTGRAAAAGSGTGSAACRRPQLEELLAAGSKASGTHIDGWTDLVGGTLYAIVDDVGRRPAPAAATPGAHARATCAEEVPPPALRPCSRRAGCCPSSRASLTARA